MASVAMCSAVSNPNVTSVAPRSLSIVFGTPITCSPSSFRRCATPNVSSPPIAMMPSRPWRSNVLRTSSAPSSRL